MTGAGLEPLADLLARNGLAGAAEEPFPNDGWSGATMTRLHDTTGRAFVLKRDTLARDWIARATADGPLLREAWFAAHGPELPWPARASALGAGRDAATGEVGILMPDLTGTLFDWDAPISESDLDRVLEGLASLHGHAPPAERSLDDGPWCPLPARINLISRASLDRPGPARDAVADRLLPGWDAFDRLATPSARDLINDLGRDPTPLVRSLEPLPRSLIHGDLKLANVGIAPDHAIELVDWQMVMIAPVAIELGWFLVSNVASLPLPPEALLERYRGAGGSLDEDGFAAAILVGLLLRGWRKGADTEAGIVHASGVSAADDLAWWCEQAVEAADRVL